MMGLLDYFQIGFDFTMCVAAAAFWGWASSNWWSKKVGIIVGVLVFMLMFYSIFHDYQDYLEYGMGD